MKSYFALGALVALSWVGLVAGAAAQDYVMGPSLLPLPEAQREYPATSYPNTPVGAFETGSSNMRGPIFGQRFANNNQNGTLPQDAPAGTPEAVPTPAAPDGVAPDWAPSPSDKQSNPYADAMSSPYGSGVSGPEGAYGYDGGDVCGYGGGAVCCCRGGWWGSVGGLVMGRDNGNPYTFSYYDSNEAGQFTTQHYNWGGGAQATIGHCFSCGGCGCKTYGIEVVYWGLYPGVNTQTTLAGQQPGNLNAILNFNQLNYNGGLASLSTENAAAHRLQSRYQINNVEINFLNFTYAGMGDMGSPSRLTYNFGAGFRWFEFRDGLQFASDPTDTAFNGAADELYYDISTVNNLVGFQLMGQSNYWIHNKLGLSIGTKFGIYDNFISHHSRIGGSAGDAVINNGPFNGTAWNFTGNSSTVALLGQIDAGLTYAMTCHWSLFAGYRVMGVSNVALTTNQIYSDLRGANDVSAINHNGSLILHGTYAGVQFSW